jgi:hypothetical protein
MVRMDPRNLHITTKTFILIALFILLIPLFFAAQSLVAGGGPVTLDITINQSSDWAALQFEGANITGIHVSSSPGPISLTNNTVNVTGTGITKMTVTFNNIQDNIQIFLAKGFTGTASATIAGVGSLSNTQTTLPVPITIETNSTSAALRFSGMEIENTSVTSLTGTDQAPVIQKDVIFLDNPHGRKVNVSLAAQVTFTQDQPVITVEKNDRGTVSATVDQYKYDNSLQGHKTISYLPVIIEMTSNTTQISFNNGSIVKATPVNIDRQRLANEIISDSFIYLNYTDAASTFHRATYVLDLNLTNASTLTAYKNNEGFVHIGIGNNDYFVAGRSDTLPYFNQTLYLGIPTFSPTPAGTTRLSTPVRIDTTSDWTDVTFLGLGNLTLSVTDSEGNIANPLISGNILSIRKTASRDTTPAHVDITLGASDQGNAKVLIEKGDLGNTSVTMGGTAVFSTSKKVKGDPTNTVSFDLPQLPLSPYQDITVQQNPVAYYFPAGLVLAERGLTLDETQPKPATLLIGKTSLPGFHPALPAPVAKGVIAFVGISMIIIGIFGITLLRREGYFSFLPRRKLSTEFVWKFALGTLEKLDVSSVLIIEAILALAVTPFLLIIDNETLAEGAAVLAYLLLVAGVVIRILEMKNLFTTDREKCMMLKLVSIGILFTAGYSGAFALLPHLAGFLLLAGMGIVTLIFLWIVYLYVNRDLYELTP